MLTTTVKYELEANDFQAKLEQIEKRLSKFDKLIGHTDENLKKIGKHGTGSPLDKLLPNNEKIQKITTALGEIPNLNMGILGSAGTLANPYVLAGAAVVAFGAYAMDATQLANQWNIGMSKANGTIRATPEGLKAISEKLQQMPRYGADMMTIPDSFEKIVSGVGDATKALDIMQVALKSARANFAAVDITGDAIVNIMGSAGNQFKNATQISDMLTQTKILGKAEFNDMATYLPRIIPYANQLGISVNEVAGSMAMLTAKGQGVEQTSMLLQNAFTALADPKKRGNIEKVVKIFDHGKIRPFVDILDDMKVKMSKLSDEGKLKFLNGFDLDAQAGSAFQQLIQNTDVLKENIKELGNAGGATNRALADTGNAMDGVNRIKEKWDSLKMSLGQKIAPFGEKLTTGFADLIDWFIKVEEKTNIFSNVWKNLTNTIKIAFFPFVQLWNVGKLVYAGFERLDKFLDETFPNTIFTLGPEIRGIVAIFRDLSFTISETFDMLTNLVTFDWGKLGDNVDNFKNHKYLDVNPDTPLKLSATDAKAMYDKAIASGVPKDKLDAMAKKWNVVIPQNETNLKPTSGADYNPSSNSKEAKKQKAKENKDIESISARGQQIRNVTIHIAKQIEKVEVITTNMQDVSINKIKKVLEDMLVASVRDSELMLAH